jgi:hypothetical protein
MIAITIIPAAYKALKAIRPEPGDAPAIGPDGMFQIWLERKFVVSFRRGEPKPRPTAISSYAGEDELVADWEKFKSSAFTRRWPWSLKTQRVPSQRAAG